MKRFTLRGFRSAFLWALLAILGSTPALSAPDNAPGATGAQPTLRLATDSAEPVVVYNLVHHMLAEQDPEPLLRVYGNGRVHVHFPFYMKRAGDYELQLSPAELNSLIRSLAQDGVIDFDHASVHAQKQQFIAQQRAAGMLFEISDTTETVIDIRLEEYRATPASALVTNLTRRFTWTNLEQDAKYLPQLNAIQGAAEGQQRLHGLLSHPDLQKLE